IQVNRQIDSAEEPFDIVHIDTVRRLNKYRSIKIISATDNRRIQSFCVGNDIEDNNWIQLCQQLALIMARKK
ncbi:hypothetical protein RDWZM_007608, partial [Blomia tropicalis]